MNRTARSVLRRLGSDASLDNERDERAQREATEAQDRPHQAGEKRPGASESGAAGLDGVPDEMLTESEKRHEQFRRSQAVGGRFTPAAERLPIMSAAEREERDKDRPKWRTTSFEGPIDKLIEKYQDLAEVQRHLTLGQSMKYEFTEDGRVLDLEGNVIYDSQKSP